MSLAAPIAPASDDAPRAPAWLAAAAPLGFALLAFAFVAFTPAVLSDGDTWSHVATGNWILDHRAVPRVDPFSFSMAGAPWTAHEWLSEVGLALAYRALGWGGVMLLTGAAFGASVYVVARRLTQDLVGPAALIVGVIAFGLISPSLLARPHLLALPIFALWCEALFAAREQDRAPRLGFAALIALWANLHGGFAFGLVLIVPFALEAVVGAPADRKSEVVRGWGLFALASLVAALATPFGVEGLLFPIRLLRLTHLGQISEWGPEDFSHPGALEMMILGLIGLALYRPFRLPLPRLLLLLGLLHMSLTHVRHEMLLAVLGPMLLARPLAEALGTPAPTPERAPRALLAGALALALALAGVRAVQPLARGNSASAPISALRALSPELKAQPVLNAYSFGGYLIFAGLRPFVDGRADMYGDAFLTQLDRIMSADPDVLSQTLKRWDIGWTILGAGAKTCNGDGSGAGLAASLYRCLCRGACPRRSRPQAGLSGRFRFRRGSGKAGQLNRPAET